MKRRGFTLLLVAVAVTLCLQRTQPSIAQNDSLQQSDFSDELPRIEPLSPTEAIQRFQVANGFEMQLVAAEPDVVDPIAIDFDAAGRMYVVEMRGYSEQGDENLGRVRLLEDRDGDGRVDHSTIFAEGLSWPTAICCFGGGVFVGAAPDILYLKDTDGDGKCDVRTTAFSGFGRGNVQGLLNSFRWGSDNRIHGATSSAGAKVRRVAASFAGGSYADSNPPLELRGRDFAFDPHTLAITATTGGGQHGICFDNWGNKFICNNSDHIRQVMYEDRYAARNPYVVPPPPVQSIAVDGPQADVFRISPIEPWRIVRTRLRVKGAVPGPVERGGKAAGYFTSATGITIYRGDTWPDHLHDTVIVGDVGGNLIHRKRLLGDGLVRRAERIDEAAEFLASRDIWFRPVQFANAPDGSLYAVDMYREVIEHPASLPPVIKRHLDLTSGRERGRIYRIIPFGAKRRTTVDLSNVPTKQLVEHLGHPNAWHRETAARLLYARQDHFAVPMLREMVVESQSPLARMHALYVLAGLDALNESLLAHGLDDSDERVRRHAVRLTEVPSLQSDHLLKRLVEKVADASIHVRYQLAFSLGEWPQGENRDAALAALLKRNADNKYMRFAVLSSLSEGAENVIALLQADEAFSTSSPGRAAFATLEQQVARHEASTDDQLGPVAVNSSQADSPQQRADRQRVFATYRAALTEAGDADAGRQVFRKHCASCHQLEGHGHAIGPNLAAAINRGREAVLLAVIDPNREVDPKFAAHIITTRDGKTHSGVLLSETATSVTLLDEENQPNTILKIDIEELINTNRSLMPEGIERDVDKRAMRDLLEYLESVK